MFAFAFTTFQLVGFRTLFHFNKIAFNLDPFFQSVISPFCPVLKPRMKMLSQYLAQDNTVKSLVEVFFQFDSKAQMVTLLK